MYAIMRDCKGVLARFTDVVIALVSFLVLVYLLDDLIRVLPLSRGLGSIVVQLTFVGVPASPTAFSYLLDCYQQQTV